MGFTPRQYDSGKVKSLPMTASTTLTRFNLVKMTSGYLAAGAAGDNEVEYIALETKTSGSGNGSSFCDVLPITDDVYFHALTDITPVQATHVGTDVDINTAAQLELAATTDKVFHVHEIIDATNKIVGGYFNKPALA